MTHAAMTSPIHVALTFDDGYWAPAYTTMRSICMVSHRPTEIVFHVMHVGLSERHKADLAAVTVDQVDDALWNTGLFTGLDQIESR